MSILITGFGLPPKGNVRTLVLFDDGILIDNADGQNQWKAIELPTHGRLIDADALWEKEKSERALKKHRPKDQSIIFDAGFLAGFRAAAQIASKMPTIIPADPEGGADNG